ncbi:MAG: large subunit ribosomal protein L16 [Candidatus Berkelbacteria bacterium Licking1014_96]|uniref:Large ribosomal subunit protein uL16 n=1 Tax=Candidatus Berkelbacteria bacterium Licking1014_96 TaxID=2017149 RepID=A0A554LE73_9BACT|nr:MAG: large subunit ribosomal protein L16 [Candidatus Berkelbacteria bacterium Licking1014_96]
MLMPRKIKYRKQQRGKRRGMASRGSALSFGQFGLKSLGRGWMTARQIEAARRAATRFIKREGELWTRIFPDKPVTSRPPEVRMGKGKGPLDHFVVVIKPGKILFEMDGVAEKIARRALTLAAHKLPLKTKFISKTS